MTYISGDYLLLIGLGIAAAGILFLGLLLSIIIFFTKKKTVEVIAWICGGISLTVFVASLAMGASKHINFAWLDLYLIANLLIFILLLQHRSKLVQKENIKKTFILKITLIALTFNRLIGLLIVSNIGVSTMGSAVFSIIYLISMVVLAACCAWCLYGVVKRTVVNKD